MLLRLPLQRLQLRLLLLLGRLLQRLRLRLLLLLGRLLLPLLLQSSFPSCSVEGKLICHGCWHNYLGHCRFCACC